MKTNDIKKGMVIRLACGWYGIMADNMKGNTRLVDVAGICREIGSVYGHDIVRVWPDTLLELGDPIAHEDIRGRPERTQVAIYNAKGRVVVEHTKAQLNLKKRVEYVLDQW